MNPIDDPLPTPDGGRIDLLVDGELSETERRELLASLDDLPDGWRRCALAFLEAQSWKDGLGSIRRESAPRPAPPAVRRARFPGGLLGTLAAMAASFMLAIGLGLVLKGVWRSGAEPGTSPSELAEAAEQAPAQPPDSEQPNPPVVPRASPDDWQLVTVPVGFGPDGAESIRLPARETDRIDEKWLERFAPRVPDELLRAFEQSGHEVRRFSHLVPFRLDDGRQVVVPFEEVELRPVGNAAYQ
jgi:hypothetical protein